VRDEKRQVTVVAAGGASAPAASRVDLPRIQPRVLRHEVLGALRGAILATEIPAGARLLEADVAARMGVSRAPVREAIRHLEQEGLVEFFPHRGAVVVGVPEAEIGAIYELRAIIEGRAMAAVATAITAAQLETLQALITEMRQVLPSKDSAAVADVDLRFHGLIVEWSGLTLLRHIWSSLDGLVRLRSYQALGRPGKDARYFTKNVAASHIVLVDALRSRDPERAAHAAREHVLEVPAILAGIDATRARGRTRTSDGRGPG
jgi:DNA-binding GntR family transcriptional regulator